MRRLGKRVGASSRAGVDARAGRPAPRGSGRDDLQEIRAWAQAQGKQVSPRGRIKKEIMDEYDAAHGR
jgi:hypothetical protein